MKIAAETKAWGEEQIAKIIRDIELRTGARVVRLDLDAIDVTNLDSPRKSFERSVQITLQL